MFGQEERTPKFWLELAVVAGDPRAAIIQLGLLRDTLAAPGSYVSDQEKATAVASLEAATASGKAEVFRVLAATYFDGFIVQADPVKSYAYLDIYQKATGDEDVSAKMAELSRNLRGADWSRVEEIQTAARRRILDQQRD